MLIAMSTIFRSSCFMLSMVCLTGCYPPGTTSPDEKSSPIPLTGTRWRLVEVNGQQLDSGMQTAKQPYLLLPGGTDSLVQGFGGCNGFFGTFKTGPADRLRFSGMGSTMMACEGKMEVETAFLASLERTDSFAIKGDTLSLHRARMAPLARLVAEKDPYPDSLEK